MSTDDARRRGRRRGEDRPRFQTLRDLAELVVLGAEVVSPLAHAVRLVDDEQADVPLELLADAGRPEPLRRDVEHPRLAVERAAERLGVLGAGALRVDQLGALAEALDLVLHERDERRDDERQRLVVLERRQLVAERLARRRSA